MSGSLKVSGAWHNVVGVKIRVGGTWRTVSSGFVRVGGTWKQWFASLISDAFNRANSGSLGTTDTGQTWTNLRSTAWAIVSNKASNGGTPSNYPVASVAVGIADATTAVDVSQGCGPVGWITDANNWWASFHYTTSSVACGGGATGWSTSNPGSCACGSLQSQSVGDCNGAATGNIFSSPQTCACGTPTSSTTNECQGGYSAGTCAGAGGTWNGSQCCFDVGHYGCSATASSHNEYRCSDSSTGTTTAHKLRLVSMVSGSIATTDDVSLASAPVAIALNTSGDTITASAYSDSGRTSLLGTNTKTPSGPSKGTSVGIVMAPGGTAQGTTVDSFSSST